MISIIVPVYNVEKVLHYCVDSVLKQTFKNFELILVNDGSIDGSGKFCDTFANQDNRISVIHKENGGVSDARNKGLEKAKGNFIAFVDPDDWIAPEIYERLLQSIHESNSEVAVCAVEMVWENKSRYQLLTPKENSILNRYEALENLILEKNSNTLFGIKCIKKKQLVGFDLI